jgi:hypothetical protein
VEELVLGLGKWLGLEYMEKREEKGIPEGERMYGEFKRGEKNQLYRSKAFFHSFFFFLPCAGN